MMNKWRRCWRYSILVVTTLLIAACVRVPKDWYGEPTHRLFKVYGYPDQVARLKDGWCLLIYQKKGSPCMASFRVDRHRIIRVVRYEGGQQCQGVKS